MQFELKKAIVKYIEEKDPDGDIVVRIAPGRDWKTGEIHYNWENFAKGRDCGQWDDASEAGAEELVRAYLLVRLTKDLGYPLDKSIVVEEQYSIGHPSRKGAWLDVRVGDRRDSGFEKSFMLIECKSPEKYETGRRTAIEEQLFNIAPQEQISRNRDVGYLVYYTIRNQNGQIREEIEIIDFKEYKNWKQWDAAGQPISSRIIPTNYGVAVTSRFVKKPEGELGPGEQALDRSKDRDFFQRLEKDLHNKLWGGSTEYNYIFKNLARLFLAKIYDEITTLPGKAYRFQVQQETDPATGRTIMQRPQQLFERINELTKESTALLGYSSKEKRTYGIEQDQIDANKVSYVVNQIEGISVVENVHARTGDILGDFFEGIISEGFKQSRGTFFTHKNIVYFIIYGLCLDDLVNQFATDTDMPRLPYICDPACGSGTFLVEAMRFITTHIPRKEEQVGRIRQAISAWSIEDNPHSWAERFIYGVDNNPDLALSTKVNMVLHRDGNLNIFRSDALKPFSQFPNTPMNRPNPSLLLNHHADRSAPYPFDVNEQFDVVMSNPPFSVPLDPQTKEEHSGRFLFADTNNSEVLFLERYFQLLRPNGRMGVVLPESIFDTAENLPVRLFLYRHFQILAIVSLPNLAFSPFTSTKTSLLFARKKTREEVEAFDLEWKDAAAEYRKIRKQVLIKWAIENERLHNTLMTLCATLKLEYEPLRNLLLPDNVSEALKEKIKTLSNNTGRNERRIVQVLSRIDKHFGDAPFREIRMKSQAWTNENARILKLVTDFAQSIGVDFKPDRYGHISPECFNAGARQRITKAAQSADKHVHRGRKYEVLWSSIQKKVERYLTKSANGDLSNDADSIRAVQSFLKSLLEERDKNMATLDLLDKYIDDVATVGEINDVMGKFPNQPKPRPFAYANAWWVFGELMKKKGFQYKIFMAEAEEIGYKRGTGNRYQMRRNDLFKCDDPNDLINTIHPDDAETILGRLRSHIRERR